MQLTVGTTPVELDPTSLPDVRESGIIVIVQNLGPGNIFIDFIDEVTEDSGLKIGAEGAYEFPRSSARSMWLVADQADTDVRYLGVD
jgi:hypothetical protein